MDLDELRERFDTHHIHRVKVGGFDIDCVLRGKYLSLDKFWSVAESGFGFCDVIFGWDIGDVCYDNSQLTGAHSGYPDTHARIDLDSFRVLPSEPNTAGFLLDFRAPDGKAHPACPRSLLKRIVARAEASGFVPMMGAEFEFWVFQETPESLRDKHYRDLRPISPGMFGYSWLRTAQHADFVHALLGACERFDIDVEGFHTETGPGVYEAALHYAPAVRAADQAALFKTLTKEVATAHGLVVTFMAKWHADLPGSSGHLHQSLWDSTGHKNLLASAKQPHGLSDLGRHYLGGLVSTLPELTALYAPNVNSYKRYVPGVWAPLTASWGVENRTAAVRHIGGDGGASTRFELRQTAADINPYIAMATCLGAGLHGIDHAIEPPAPFHGDASADRTGKPLPRDLASAALLLRESEVARAILGEPFVDHYARTREWEVRQFAKAVSDWELARYFESV
ncbi:MAG: glutamine synthetase family protein [Polyangiales bacterium]